ncbi:MAG: adenylate/guanylate cyclase domain-containing protein [Acidimicrobiia bacterium]|nr:adenylate/guanylate cyclase domain-containing protein [Acidimicrobiia bacterium]
MATVTVEVREPGRTPLTLVLDGPVVVGRECDGLLLGDTQISRRHLELRPSRSGLEVTDLGSTNGTFVGDERVDGTRRMAPDESVRLGSTTIRMVDRADPASTGSRTTLSTDGGKTSIHTVAELVTANRPLVGDGEHRHGTITIVFSDIENSTARMNAIGDRRWFEILGRHNELVRESVIRYGGTEVKNQGDGFMLTFPSARRALQAMAQVQRSLTSDAEADPDSAIRVRVGMHTGEVIVDDDGDLFGQHVNLAARIGAQAVGREILVSSLTRAILETRREFTFGEPRIEDLKGLSGTHTLHPVQWD